MLHMDACFRRLSPSDRPRVCANAAVLTPLRVGQLLSTNRLLAVMNRQDGSFTIEVIMPSGGHAALRCRFGDVLVIDANTAMILDHAQFEATYEPAKTWGDFAVAATPALVGV